MPMTAVVLALGAAALWGTGDFFGGLATRRLNVLIVLFWSQLVGLAGRRVWIAASGSAGPAAASSSPARRASRAPSGSAASTAGWRSARWASWRRSRPPLRSCRSPSASLRGDSPAAVQWAGIALALAGIVLVSREPGGARRRASRRGSASRSSRRSGSGCSSSGSARRRRRARPGRLPPPGSARSRSSSSRLRGRGPPRACHGGSSRSSSPSASSTPGANALIAVATTHGSIGIVGVLSALYPITTILLARAVLHERLGTTRTAGGLIALGGAALIAAG